MAHPTPPKPPTGGYTISGTIGPVGAGHMVKLTHVARGGAATAHKQATAGPNGEYSFTHLAAGDYTVTPPSNLPYSYTPSSTTVSVGPSQPNQIANFTVATLTATPSPAVQGVPAFFTLSPAPQQWPPPPPGGQTTSDSVYGTTPLTYNWTVTCGPSGPITVDPSTITAAPNNPGIFNWDTAGVEPLTYNAVVHITSSDTPAVHQAPSTTVSVSLRPFASGDTIPVTMQRAAEPQTSDEALWVAIRYSANQLLFQNYITFVDTIMCPPPANFGSVPAGSTTVDYVISLYLKNPPCLPPLDRRRFLPFPNTDAYRLLKIATECFVMLNCGVYLNTATLTTLVNSAPTPPSPPNPPIPGQPFPVPGYDVNDDATRLNQSPSTVPTSILYWWQIYLASGNQYLNLNDPASAQNAIIPYLALVRSRLNDLPMTPFCKMGMDCYGILQRKLTNPCLIELIWSYWHEEAMLVQTLNVISRRFQNFRGPAANDPLMRFDIDPLRMLNQLLWGYIQDEQHRLTVRRRAYEYSHEYGLALEGKALRALRPSDNRSKFLEAFHNLLYLCTIFFKEDDDTTVVADGFPVLNALREVHYILAAGAHNQFGELPSTARQEMLMQQWLLARPEMREFLGGKVMVPYPEQWMDRVDNVKGMEGWTDVSVVHFHDLGVYGEQIVLSVRYGAWSLTTATAAQAANWARYWRNEIQGYIHAYRAVTGVDLTTEPVNSTLPSVLLLKRLAAQRPAAR
jgi:hypothetical protein